MTAAPTPLGPEGPSLTAMAAADRAAAHSVSAIALNQIAQVVGSLLFVAFVPRTLGTVVYGQLAFAFALISILQMCGELGYQEIFSRYLPEVIAREGRAGIVAMTRQLFAVRFLAGLGLGAASLLVAHWAASWLDPAQLGLIALSVTLRVWCMGPFPLLLGLGHTYKWSVETTWRQLVVTALLVAVVRVPSLTLALLAMGVHELVFLGLGLWWVRGWLFGKPDVARKITDVRSQKSGDAAAPGRPRTSELLKFGFIFSLANLSLVLLFRISPISVELLTRSHTETGFFDLGLGGLMLIYTLLGQVAYAFVPILTTLHLDQRPEGAGVWLGRIVVYSTILVAMAAGGLWAVAAPMAPLLFGAGFGPAAQTMRVIGFALLPLPLAWAGVTQSAVERRPARKLWAALLGMAVFLVAAPALRGGGAAGIALAFGLAMLGYAAGFGRGAAQAARAGGWRWAVALLATALFSPLIQTRFTSLSVAFAAWAALGALYIGLMVIAGIVRPADARLFVRALRHR